jgi:hypothetical protein
MYESLRVVLDCRNAVQVEVGVVLLMPSLDRRRLDFHY